MFAHLKIRYNDPPHCYSYCTINNHFFQKHQKIELRLLLLQKSQRRELRRTWKRTWTERMRRKKRGSLMSQMTGSPGREPMDGTAG